MATRNSVSGGVFLTIGILSGLLIGAFAGQAMVGVLIGTAAGAAAAALVWLMDRRKQKSASRVDGD